MVNFLHYLHIVQKYENVDLSELRKLEKVSIKIGKIELDIRFLNNCKLYNIFIIYLFPLYRVFNKK